MADARGTGARGALLRASPDADAPYDLSIVGAGPVGLEAAAAAADAGLRVVLLERGRPGEHVAAWGHVRLFTPFDDNVGPAGRALSEAAGIPLPAPDAILTGARFREAYLLPLAEALRSRIDLLEGRRVVSASRRRLLKGEELGDDARAEDPFRLLCETVGGEEELLARRVFDCSGTWSRPNWAGPGGTPARGERALRERVRYHLPDVLGADRERFSGARTLVLGAGHSAATAVRDLAALAERAPGTRFLWATRGAGVRPVADVPDDPLPERAALAREANRIAAEPPSGSRRLPAARLVAIAPAGDGSGLEATLSVAGELRGPERFDEVVACVGYEPDDSLYRQLQVHECYASRAPMKLAAALLAAAGDGPADCLTLGGFGPEALENPEPGFFILGAKSYGKSSAFLLRSGYEQVGDALSLIRPRARASGGGGA